MDTGTLNPTSTAKQLGIDVAQKGGKTFLQKYGKQIAVAGVGFAAWNWTDNVKAAVRDPSKANLTRLGLSTVETGAEAVSAGSIIASPWTGGASLSLVAPAEGVSAAAGTGELGTYLVEHRDKIWNTVKDPETYRKLYGSIKDPNTYKELAINAKDSLVEKYTDDKGLSSLWYDEEKERQKGYAALNAEGRSR